MKILFITWDGPQVSYLTGLFLPIFSRLAEYGFKFHVLQFTWGDLEKINKTKSICNSAGVGYDFVIVKRRPVSLGGFFTAVLGARTIRNLIKAQKIDAVMPRSTLPAMSVLLGLKGTKIPMIFDADGLPLDERVDFGQQSPSGFSYRFLRDVEAQAVRRSIAVLTRSTSAGQILLNRAGAGVSGTRLYVVLNGRDSSAFIPGNASDRNTMRQKLGIDLDAPVVAYVGSLGGKYRIDEMLMIFSFVLDLAPNARFVILTPSVDAAKAALLNFPKLAASVMIDSVHGDAVGQIVRCADVGLSVIEAKFSMQAASAIKTGEYLLSGVPVIGTAGVGNSEEIIVKAGFVLHDLNMDALKAAASWFVSEVMPQRESYRERCRAVGKEYYSIDSAVMSYQRALSSVVI